MEKNPSSFVGTSLMTIRPHSNKVWEIQTAPCPMNVSQLRSFLGSVNYYGKFIDSMKKLRGPLDELLKDNAKFEWKSDHQEAFNNLKKFFHQMT